MNADIFTRYSRQTILPEIGKQGQESLSRASVLVIGAGGLGCPALLYLAGAGVGTIGIVDHDRLDISNLQRQVLFHTKDQGLAKVTVARRELLALNPEIEVHAFEEDLTDLNALSLFSSYDVIVDGTDNFAAKFLINDVAVKSGKPVIHGAIQGFEGQVSVFDAAKGPCYRCLHPQPPQSAVMNCAQAGVIGALAGIAGTIQAMEAIKIIIGHPSFRPLIGKLWMIDARTMETRMIVIPKREDCPVCSHPAAEIVPQYASPACSTATVTEIDCARLSAMADTVLIDVREHEEWQRGHIPKARHLPLSGLRENPGLFSAPGKAHCVLYCQLGMRSQNAAEILLRAGFTDIYSLKDGYDAWLKENP